MRGPAGASYVASCMIMMLDEPVDMAHIYDCQTHMNFSLLCDQWRNYTKTAKAVFAFNDMAKMDRAFTECDVDGVFLAAGHSGDSAIAMVSCFECKGAEDIIEINGCRGFSVSVKLVDDYFNGEEVAHFEVNEDKMKLPISLRPYTVIIIEMKKNA